ncbi:MAG: MFS transporter [Lewinella sp.]|nr:MFS transporter [Lewinella sp.]
MMRKESLLLVVLAIVQFTHIVDFMIIMPLGKQFMHIFEINPQQFSLLVSAYAFSAFLAGLVSAMFIDRFDRKQALLFLYIGFMIGTVACGLANDYHFFLAARAVTGAFGGTLGAMILAIVGDVVPLERRGAAMGWVMMAFSVASVVGVPAGIFLASAFGVRAPFFSLGIIAVAITFLIYFVVPVLRGHMEGQAGKAHPKPKEIIGAIAHNPNQRLALLFTLTLMLGHFTIIPFIAPYMQLNIGFGDGQIGLVYTFGGLMTVVCLPLFGRLADRFGHARVFAIASFFALFSIFAITNLPPVSMAIALVATSSFFVVASGRNVPATTMITAVVKPENRGSFLSIRQSVNQAGLALSSFIAGSIITERPDGSLENYQLVGYLAIGMSIVAILLARRLRVIA